MSPRSIPSSRRSRPSALAILVAAMLALLPVLAALQYRWLGQLSDAERERLRRTLQASVADLGRTLDLEMMRIAIGLQIDGSTMALQAWALYAERLSAWSAAAAAPDIVSEIWLVDTPARQGADGEAALRLRRWNRAAGAFVDAAWPAALEAVRARLERFQRGPDSGDGATDGADDPIGEDESLIVVPVLPPPPASALDFRGPIEMAFTIVQLDERVLTKTILPALVSRHLGAPGESDYHIAVVSRRNPRQVIYEAHPDDARVLAAGADVVEPLLGVPGARFRVFRRAAGAGFQPSGRPDAFRRGLFLGSRAPHLGSAAPEAGTVRIDAEGPRPEDGARWQLLVRHRAGSLEAAVDRARRRNLAVGFGLLLMMAAGTALIVVAARRAQRLGAQQIEFVAAVSHELRTPVAILASAGDNLAQGVIHDPARVREYGAAIRAEARRLGETVERVLGFAGIQAGRVIGERAPVAVHRLIEEAVAASEPVTTRHAARVDVAVPPALPLVTADAAAIRSAIENLIANAAKHNTAGAVLRITADADASCAEVRIRVSDDGPGIPAAERARIFEPFYRGADAVARRIQGSGLGLSIVKSIVEAHDGRVSLETTPGLGSTFTLHLPVGADSPAVAREHVPQERPA